LQHAEWSPYAVEPSGSRFPCRLPHLGTGDGVILALVLAGVGWFVWRAGDVAGYEWQWGLVLEFLVRATPSGWEPGLLVRGFGVTLRLGVWSMLLALGLGGLLG
ncbi:MAG: hypothetical protein RR317_03225, partial [Bilophila sp.]